MLHGRRGRRRHCSVVLGRSRLDWLAVNSFSGFGLTNWDAILEHCEGDCILCQGLVGGK